MTALTGCAPPCTPICSRPPSRLASAAPSGWPRAPRPAPSSAAGCAAVCLLIVAVGTAGVRAAGAVLRGIDSGLLRIKNIRIHCPHCGERVPYPGYLCPGQPQCTRWHRDVRPGRFGIIRRYCRCGKRMRTLLLFGSAQMTAFCPRCGQLWQHSPGGEPEIVLAFSGAAGAGKTRLVSAMITQLTNWATAKKLAAGPADKATADSLQGAAELLRPDRTTPVTPPERRPRSLLIRVSSGKATPDSAPVRCGRRALPGPGQDGRTPVPRFGADVHPGDQPAAHPGAMAAPAGWPASRAGQAAA